jgi:hypothetical protein
MTKVKDLEVPDQRKGDRRQPDGENAFEAPDRRKADRRSGSKSQA